MKRRQPVRDGNADLPEHLREFDLAAWSQPGDHDPELPGRAGYLARVRWYGARRDWWIAHGVDPLERLREQMRTRHPGLLPEGEES